MEQLEVETLAKCGIIDDPNMFKKKMNVVRTRNIFEQQKFNLLREENEGFAKLIVELNQLNINASNVETVEKNVQALIGFFNLDPNRVLDIILDSFQNNLWNSTYIQLLKGHF